MGYDIKNKNHNKIYKALRRTCPKALKQPPLPYKLDRPWSNIKSKATRAVQITKPVQKLKIRLENLSVKMIRSILSNHFIETNVEQAIVGKIEKSSMKRVSKRRLVVPYFMVNSLAKRKRIPKSHLVRSRR